MKFKNLGLFGVVILASCFFFAHSEGKKEILERVEKQHVLMPQTCFEHSHKVLLANNLKENKDYTFLKTIYSGEAYKDIYGVLELTTTQNFDESKFISVYKQILDSCFANSSVGFMRKNSGSEWSDLSDFLTELNDLDVKVHEIKINDELIRVFIDKDDLDRKRKEKINNWLNGND